MSSIRRIGVIGGGIDRILDDNSGAVIFGPPGVAAAASGFDVTVVKDGDEVKAGSFTLRFFGEKHAVIHASIPVVDNVGVLVNGQLYYAGDSFTIPEAVGSILWRCRLVRRG